MNGMRKKKKHTRESKGKEPRLLMDKIFESPDDLAVRAAMHQYRNEEVDSALGRCAPGDEDREVARAYHRADLRLALRFQHLLPSKQRENLARLVDIEKERFGIALAM